jgi:hypothetical protein
MSENATTIVELSLHAAGARARAAELTRWLLDTGIVIPNTERDELWEPSEYRAGPSVRTATELWSADDAQLANNGVDVVVERMLHHPSENYEPPACPMCATVLGEEAHESLGDAWLAGPEPLVRCDACGAEALIGDWPGEWTFHVGDLAVSFNNWPPLNDAFLEEVRRRIGPRSRVVLEHI